MTKLDNLQAKHDALLREHEKLQIFAQLLEDRIKQLEHEAKKWREHVMEGHEEIAPPDVDTLADLLSLVTKRALEPEEIEVLRRHCRRLSPAERQVACDWAGAVHHDAADNVGVVIPQRPYCLHGLNKLISAKGRVHWRGA